MERKLVVLVTVICFLVGCSSTTMIKSNPPGAKLYLDGQFKCETPCSHSDTAASGASKTVLLKKEGYKDFTGTIKKERTQVGPIIGGIFLLFPFIWTLGYPEEYTFEMEVPKETSSLSAGTVNKGTSPPMGSPAASGSLEIQSRIQGAQVFIDGQNVGEVPVRISNLTPGSHEVQVIKKDYGEWKQGILIQPNENKVIEVVEVVLVRPSGGEEDLLGKIFLLDNCRFAKDKFEYWIKFRQGGILEGSPRTGSNYGTPPREQASFKRLAGRWVMEKKRVKIDLDSVRGISTRKVLRIEIQLDNAREGIFESVAESSKPVSYAPFFSPTETEKYSCFMKEWHSP